MTWLEGVWVAGMGAAGNWVEERKIEGESLKIVGGYVWVVLAG